MRQSPPGNRFLFTIEDAGLALDPVAGDPSAHPAGGKPDLRLVADTFELAGIAARHHIQLTRTLGEPYRGTHLLSAAPEGGQANVFLTVQLRG